MDLSSLRKQFPRTDFERGLQYYQTRYVKSMVCTPSLDNSIRVECKVNGSQIYYVSFFYHNSTVSHTLCTCPRYNETSCCKHIVAAILTFLRKMEDGEFESKDSDRAAKSMLESYLKKSQEQSAAGQTPARLVPKLTGTYLADYPCFSFRIGYDKLYVVRNIEELLKNIHLGQTVRYGKNLLLNHSIRQFDEKSQKLIQLMLNEYLRNQSMRRYSLYTAPINVYDHNTFTFLGDSFDRAFDILSDAPLESSIGKDIFLTKENPTVSIQIAQTSKASMLNIKMPGKFRFFGGHHSLYALGENKLMRCSDEFMEKLFPLLKQGTENMRLSFSDLSTFCACVLPEISSLAIIEDSDQLLQKYIPEDCTPQFCFDMEQEVLILNLVFAYGVHKYKFFKKPSERDGVRRNAVQENAAIDFVEKYFLKNGNHYEMTAEEQVYNFLTDTIDVFRERGEVYLSDRLQNKQARPSPAQIGVSVSDGLLLLTMDTGGFPPEELSALYQSMLQRRKYHRLADGRYLKLDGSSSEKVAEIAQMLQLSKQDLEKGTISMPAYRGLYLDSMLSGNEGIRVTRDTQFRNMVRNFKTLSESDYALPQSIQSILRPYQQTGFQWLKTLEGYGFGGILADEMGLARRCK